MKSFYLDLCQSENLRAAVNQNKYSIGTNLGCHCLWLIPGHPEEGSGDEHCCPCSQQGVKGFFWGGCPAFAFLHTGESHTGRHLQNAEDEREKLKELMVCKCALPFTWAGTAVPEVLFGEQTQGPAIHLKASLLRPAQWVFLLRPVEPESYIFFVPQRRVDSCRSHTEWLLTEVPAGYFPIKQRLTESSR